jgi:hypothetical protein
MEKIRKYIVANQKELLDKLNQKLFEEKWNKYASGDQLQWELDSLGFYYSGNPLDKLEETLPVKITKLDDIEEGKIDGFFNIKGKQIPKMYLYSIAGTVLDRNTTKGIVTVQTADGVVGVKIYKDLFAFYNHEFSNEIDGETVSDNSFFDVGTHLLITGVKRGETFIPKVYKTSGIKPIMQIVLDKDNKFVCLKEKQTDLSGAALC